MVNQYIAEFERNGSYGLFTDALYPLADSLAGSHARIIYLVDFGNWYNLNFLEEGRLNLQQAWPTDSKPEGEIAAMLANEGALFVNRVPSPQVQHKRKRTATGSGTGPWL